MLLAPESGRSFVLMRFVVVEMLGMACAAPGFIVM